MNIFTFTVFCIEIHANSLQKTMNWVCSVCICRQNEYRAPDKKE